MRMYDNTGNVDSLTCRAVNRAGYGLDCLVDGTRTGG